MWQRIPEGVARRALSRLFALYLLASAGALLFPHRPRLWTLLGLLHILGAALLLGLGPPARVARTAAVRWPRAGRLVADWYALALMPLLYAEVAVLNVAVHGGRYFDSVIVGWETALFGGSPSQELAVALPWLPLSEVLHASYLSYYFVIYLPPLYLYLRRRTGEQQTASLALMLAFFAHYLVFIAFPVEGPRYLFPPPGGELAQGWVYRLTHTILEAGSSRGAAFPSSHVGVAVVQAALAFQLLPRAAPLLTAATLGLAVGAVYGGFHYASDALAGLVLGLLLVLLGPFLVRWLAGLGQRGIPGPAGRRA
jgi:membrane-associated phospholipid phosphatase